MKDEIYGGFGLIGWIFVLSQNSLNHQSQSGANGFSDGPIHSGAFSEVFSELDSDLLQRLIAKSYKSVFDVVLTLNTYSPVLEGMQAQASDRLGNLLYSAVQAAGK